MKKRFSEEQIIGVLKEGEAGLKPAELYAPRLVSEYGGQLSDWSKVSSSSYTATDGTQFEIHAYRNAVTGQVVEPKSIPLK